MSLIYTNSSCSKVYSDVVESGNTLYLSGLVSEDLETGEPLVGDIALETKTILSNAVAIVERHGSSKDKIARIEIFMRNYGDLDKMNDAYIEFFKGVNLPSRICLGVNDLYKPCNLEMLVIAVK